MNAIAAPLAQVALADTATLESILDELQQYGRPRVCRFEMGWFCGLDMHVASVGTEFKISSAFGHATPRAAAQQCQERMQQTLRDLAHTKA